MGLRGAGRSEPPFGGCGGLVLSLCYLLLLWNQILRFLVLSWKPLPLSKQGTRKEKQLTK